MAASPLCSRSRRMTLAAGLGRSGSETVFVSSRYCTAYNRTSRPGRFPLCFRIPRPGRARAWRDRQLQRSPDTHRRIRAGPRQAARTFGDRPAPPPVRRAGSVPTVLPHSASRISFGRLRRAPLQSNVSRSFVGPSCSFRCTLYQVYTGTTLPRAERSGRTAGQFAETRTRVPNRGVRRGRPECAAPLAGRGPLGYGAAGGKRAGRTGRRAGARIWPDRLRHWSRRA